MTQAELLQSFYDGLVKKDDSWQKNLADDIIFADASNTLSAHGKEEFIKSFQTFLRGVANVTVKQMIISGDDACVVVGYDYVNPKGEKMSQDDAEVWKIADGKLQSLTIYFDITAFRNFMRG